MRRARGTRHWSEALGSLEAQMDQAEWELEEATVYAPAKGVVTNMTLRPGQVASKMVGQPVMTFVSSEAARLVATFPPNALRHITVGDAAEIALDRHPGEILKARVATLVDISSQGQLAPSGDIPIGPRSRRPAASPSASSWTRARRISRYREEPGAQLRSTPTRGR